MLICIYLQKKFKIQHHLKSIFDTFINKAGNDGGGRIKVNSINSMAQHPFVGFSR